MKTSCIEPLLLQAKALADATRLRLVGILASHELTVGETVSVLGMGQSRISRHLKILVDAGFLTCTRSGAWALYRVPDPVPSVLAAVLKLLEEDPEVQADRQRAAAVLAERRGRVVRFFDAVAQDWKTLSQEILGDFDLDGVVVARLDGASVVVDLGCGPGFLLERLAAAGKQAVGVDHSPRMLEAAARRVGTCADISLRLGDLAHLPVRDAEADGAVLSLVLHHLSHPQEVLAEAARAVRPGGRLVLADYLSHGEERLRRRHGDHWLGFRLEDLTSWVEAAGFFVQTVDEYPLPSRVRLVVLAAERHGPRAGGVSPKESL
jgi:ArsR family transcriptional regulator